MNQLKLLKITLLCLPFALSWHLPARADEPKLEGFYYLNADDCTKDKKNDNCKINLQVFGQAARLLYENMKAKAVPDACVEGMQKTDASGLHCFIDSDKKYGCDLGYNFAQSKTVASDVDC